MWSFIFGTLVLAFGLWWAKWGYEMRVRINDQAAQIKVLRDSNSHLNRANINLRNQLDELFRRDAGRQVAESVIKGEGE